MINTELGGDARYGRRGSAANEDIPSPGRDSRTNASALGQLSNALSTIIASAKQACADLFALMTLELRRAGAALAWMVALGALGVLMVVTAWLGLMTALALWLISMDVPPAGAVLVVVAINLVGAAISFYSCARSSRDLAMPATRRQLSVAAAEMKVS